MKNSIPIFSDMGIGQFLIRVIILMVLLILPTALSGNLTYGVIIGAIYVLASLATLKSMLPPARGNEAILAPWRFYLYGLIILAGGIGVCVVFSLMMAFVSVALLHPDTINAISLLVTIIIISTVLTAVRLLLRVSAAACFKPSSMTINQASFHFQQGGLGAGPFLSALTLGAGFVGFIIFLFGSNRLFMHQVLRGREVDPWTALTLEPRLFLLILATALLLCLHRPFLAVQLPRIMNRFYEDADYPTVSQTRVLSLYGLIMLAGFGLLAYLAIWTFKVIAAVLASQPPG